jgi:hypothetical protein
MKRPNILDYSKTYNYIGDLEKYVDYLENKDKKKKKKPVKKLDSHDFGGGYIGEALLSCT